MRIDTTLISISCKASVVIIYAMFPIFIAILKSCTGQTKDSYTRIILVFTDELHAKYKLILQMNYEKIIQDCEEELNRLKVREGDLS